MWLGIGFLLVCGGSVWLWPWWFAQQWLVQCLLCAALLYGAVRYYRFQSVGRQKVKHYLMLAPEGKVQWLVEDQYRPFRLLGSSISCDWFCVLMLAADDLPGLAGDGDQKQRLWVFRDSVDEQSYRRLCRIIRRIEHQNL